MDGGETFHFLMFPLFFPKPKSTNTHCIKKIRRKKKRRFAGYTFSRCRISGNRCGCFSRNLSKGLIISFYASYFLLPKSKPP